MLGVLEHLGIDREIASISYGAIGLRIGTREPVQDTLAAIRRQMAFQRIEHLRDGSDTVDAQNLCALFTAGAEYSREDLFLRFEASIVFWAGIETDLAHIASLRQELFE